MFCVFVEGTGDGADTRFAEEFVEVVGVVDILLGGVGVVSVLLAGVELLITTGSALSQGLSAAEELRYVFCVALSLSTRKVSVSSVDILSLIIICVELSEVSWFSVTESFFSRETVVTVTTVTTAAVEPMIAANFPAAIVPLAAVAAVPPPMAVPAAGSCEAMLSQQRGVGVSCTCSTMSLRLLIFIFCFCLRL